MLDPLILRVNGKDFGGWTEATVTASANEAVRSFEVKTTEPDGDTPILPMDKVEVIARSEEFGDEVMVTGYVDSYKAEISEDAHDVTISGRGKTQDLVDCAAVHDTGRFEEKDIKDIATELAARYDCEVEVKATNLPKVEKFQINIGETVFDSVERLARSQDLLLVGNAKGGLEILDGPEDMVQQGLIEGEPLVLRISVELSAKTRYSEYITKAQRAFSAEAKDLKIEKRAVDGSVKRVRTKVTIAEGDIDDAAAKKRADNQMTTEQGRSIKASCTVSGFFHSGGKIWKPAQKVYCRFPSIHLDQTMAIESVKFSKDANDKTTTELTLVDERALKGKKKDARAKSGKGFKMDTKNNSAVNTTGGGNTTGVG